MTLGQSQVGGAFRTRAGAGNLIGRDRRLRPERAWNRSEGVLVGGGRAIDPAVDVDGPKRAGAEHHAATTPTAGAVIIGSAARVGGPGVCAGAAARIDGETSERAGLRHHNDCAARAATSTAVIQRDNAG